MTTEANELPDFTELNFKTAGWYIDIKTGTTNRWGSPNTCRVSCGKVADPRAAPHLPQGITWWDGQHKEVKFIHLASVGSWLQREQLLPGILQAYDCAPTELIDTLNQQIAAKSAATVAKAAETRAANALTKSPSPPNCEYKEAISTAVNALESAWLELPDCTVAEFMDFGFSPLTAKQVGIVASAYCKVTGIPITSKPVQRVWRTENVYPQAILEGVRQVLEAAA